jgi:hypothetical protein
MVTVSPDKSMDLNLSKLAQLKSPLPIFGISEKAALATAAVIAKATDVFCHVFIGFALLVIIVCEQRLFESLSELNRLRRNCHLLYRSFCYL